MKSSFRLSTALVTSLSLAATHVPFAAFAQTDADACLAEESAEACLARALEAAAAGDAEGAAEAARQAEAAAAAEEAVNAAAAQDAAAEAARVAEEAVQAEAANAAAVAEAEANAAADAIAQAEAEAAAAAAQVEADVAAQAEADAAAATAQAEADAAAQVEADAAAQVEANAAAQVEADLAAQIEADAAAQVEADVATQAEAEPAAQVEEPAVVAEEPATDPVDGTAPTPDEEALAAALAEASAATTGEAVSAAPEQTAEDAAALEAAAAVAADAEQEAVADPTLEAEAEAEAEAADAQEQLQSMALADDAQPTGAIVNETITEETARSAEDEFAAIVTSEPAADAATGTPIAEASSGRNGGITPLEAALLAGAAGLVVGSIVSGNRQVVNRAEDRVVVLRPQGDYQVIRDDDVLLRRPGNDVSTENFSDGSSRSIVTQPDGARIVTIRDRDLRILRRTYFAPNGTSTVLIDDTAPVQPVIVSQLPQILPTSQVPVTNVSDADTLRAALEAQRGYGRSFSLAQIRSIRAVRDLAPAIDLETVTFASGSAAIGPDQARALLALGTYMADAIARNPQEIFLVEGHTDAVGSAAYNLALSDRRAESVALSLSQYFGVPAQNMVIQGYGEDYLRVATLADERLNRRVGVRRITDLLQVAAAN